MNIQVFQTIHKPFPRPSSSWITPVAVSNYNEPGLIKDNTGDNIAHLNPYYGEFTTMYWAWKNAKDYDAIGFYHYRRYLHVLQHDENFSWEGKLDKGCHYQVNYEYNEDFLTTLASDQYKDRIECMLESSPVISGFPMRFDVPVPLQWMQHHPIEPLQVFLSELQKQYPQHVNLIKQFYSVYGQICWPVFIMRRNTFLRFAEQLFAVLDRVFKQIGSPYDSYNNRYLCFLVERFLPLWYLMERINPNYVSTVTFFSLENTLDGKPLDKDIKNRKQSCIVQKGFSSFNTAQNYQ